MYSYQTLRRLAYFAAIADAGSIRGAARKLDLSVPVVSAALSELEDELNVSLATRSTRSLHLTAAGEQIYQQAKAMLNAANAAVNYTKPDKPLSGKLYVTLPVELTTNWLAQSLQRFRESQPQIEIIVDADDDVISLKDSRYDMAIRTRYIPPSAKLSNKLQLKPIKLVCISRQNPDCSLNNDQILIDATLIASHQNNSSSLIAKSRREGTEIELKFKSKITMNNRNTAISWVEQGLGVSLVFKDSVKQDIKHRRLIQLFPDLDFGYVQLEIVMRDSLPSPQSKLFAEYLIYEKGLEHST